MRLFRLVWNNLTRNAFRSLAIGLCAALVATLALAATFVVRGAEAGLRRNLERLGADILILPWGTITEKIGGVRLMSAAIDGWMPREYLDRVAAIEGVEQVSPQQYLGTFVDSPYRPRAEMHLVAFDPATDFVLRPWLERGLPGGLTLGEAVTGAAIVIPGGGHRLSLYGRELAQVDRLAPTGTDIDYTVFVSLETAAQILAQVDVSVLEELRIMPGSYSALMVRATLPSDPHEVAVRILEEVPSVTPLETPGLFQAGRRHMVGVLRTLLGVLGGIWAITIVFVGLVFTVAVNERRWEIGVLRALGFSRWLVLRMLLLEGAALSLAGGLVGVVATVIGLAVWGDELVHLARLPLYIPAPSGLIFLSLGGQLAALVSVTLAALIPAWRISHQEAALTMRE